MADSIVRSCLECGAALVKKRPQGRWPIYCSTKCRQQKYRSDPEWAQREREKARVRSAAQYRPITYLRRPCAFCGGLFEPTRKDALYCKDRTCRGRRTTAKAVQRDPDYHRAFDCAWCGAHQIPSVTCAPHASKFCPGQSCKRSWHGSGGLSLAEVKRLKAQERLNRAAIGTAGSRNYLASRCPRCGEQAITPYHPLAAGYCSSRCSSRDNKDRRRAREAGAAITPGKRYEVYERDNWTCYICEYEVDRDADPGSNWAPSVDHVVALVNGGNHGLDNWRCAHRWCNSLKRDLPLADVA